MFDNDLLGWQLDDVLDEYRVKIDDVLEGFECDFVVDGVAIDSIGEPSDALLDEGVRERIDRAERPSVFRAASALSIAKRFAERDKRVYFDRDEGDR